MTTTRGSTQTSVSRLVGSAKTLPITDLATNRCVLQQMLLIRQEDPRDSRHISIHELSIQTAALIIENWNHVNSKITETPVIITSKQIVARLDHLWSMVEKFSNPRKVTKGDRRKRRKSGDLQAEKEEFLKKLDKLFDILNCQCPLITCTENNCERVCKMKVHICCSCPRDMKIPTIELEFIYHQRTKTGVKSMMMMANPDLVETRKQLKLAQRKEREKKGQERLESQQNPQVEVHDGTSEVFIHDDHASQLEDDIAQLDIVKVDEIKTAAKQNRLHFPLTIKAGVRFGCTSRGLAAITTSTLVDLGIVTKNDPHLIVDKSKVEREKERVIKQLVEEASEDLKVNKVDCILFDGKKDLTRVRFEVEGSDKIYHGMQREEHISVCSAEGYYLTHFVPNDPTQGVSAAKAVSDQLLEYLKEFGLDKSLLAIGGDSTPANTGYKGGSIHFLEVGLGRRLVWIICQLHTNELPLRHLIIDLDGPTASGDKFTGPLGKALDLVEDMPYNPSFKVIKPGPSFPELSQDIIDDLSTDQQYGYRIILAIGTGSVSKDLFLLAIGNVSLARWLTIANRFLKMWVSVHNFKGNNLKNLEAIVEFIIMVYYTMWFNIKVAHRVVDGPRHVLMQMQLVKKISQDSVKKIVIPRVESTAWFAHPENILLSLLASKEETERRFAIRVILDKVRKGEKGDSSVRTFKVPTINWKAFKLKDLIDWDQTAITEPVVTTHMSSEELLACLDSPLKVPDWTCHTQPVERTVSKMVAGREKRDGWIRTADASRRELPVMESKQDFMRLLV